MTVFEKIEAQQPKERSAVAKGKYTAKRIETAIKFVQVHE